MNEVLRKDAAQLANLLEQVKSTGLQYLEQINLRPTNAQQAVELQPVLLEEGLGAEAALREFNQRFEPLMVAASGPRYWGFVTGGSTPAAIAGDWLTSVYDQNSFAVKGFGDISANIELETIQLLLNLLELPGDFLGGFVTGATMSNFTCLAVARQWIGKQSGKDIAKDGLNVPVHILAATPHSSAIKSLALLGIGSNRLIAVNTEDENRESMQMADLENRITALQGAPFILISSGGTVNTVDFDDFAAIAALKKKYNFWWHIDAAFGGFAACSDAHKHLLKGWEAADSITVDCHKWLNVPYESAVFLVQQQHRLLQVETFQNSNAPYLGDPLENFSYMNFLPENSRRLKALPAWFSLKAYGKQGYKEIVENCIALAQQFGQYIEQSPSFELLAPVRLNTVCFTLKAPYGAERAAAFLHQLNSTGKVFMTPTVYKGQKGIRAALVNWRTTVDDLQLVQTCMEQAMENL
ncbi:MAG TPA: pyridoxal-dependent decarboxylase [Sediminibacterium sp.]|nr:pyridoxal-dependent decarboxylase [Sediminibacterium sp.]